MMPFQEKNLVEKLDKILRKQFGTNLVFHEFSAGYGIADLVLAPNFSFRKGSVIRQPVTNFYCLKLLLSLKENIQYDILEIIQLMPQLTLVEIKKHLKTLERMNYIVTLKKNEYLRPIAIDNINPIKKVIAIEVKLKDHKNGLIQAKRYQYFADESYLAILKTAEKNINLEEFNKHNIGLILFDRDNQTIEIIEPKPQNSIREKSISIFAKEMMLSRFINP